MPTPPPDPTGPTEQDRNPSEKAGSPAGSISPADGTTVAGSDGGLQLSDEKVAIQDEVPDTKPAKKERGRW